MKLYIKSLLILGLMVAMTQACSEGCRACNPDDSTKCLVCDSSRSYVLDQHSACVIVTVSNCDIKDASGGCYVCSRNYFLDTTSKACILASVVISNCTIMSGPETCSSCVAGFYLSNNQCVRAAQRISKCQVYADETHCSQCRQNFIPSIDKLSCESVVTNECKAYRKYSCKLCDHTKSISNRNAYLIKPFGDKDTATITANLNLFATDSASIQINSFCMDTTVSNCATYTSYKQCETCEDGYILTASFNCVAPILNNLSGCDIFNSATACKTCKNGFYLQNGGCVESSAVESCQTYAAASDACYTCATGYFLNGAACSARVNSADDCDQLDRAADRCAVCDKGYVTADGQNHCFKLPDNCIEAATTDFTTPAFTCAKCDRGFFVSGDNCATGTVDNCDVYEDAENTCARCNGGFEVNNGQCQDRANDILACAEYEADAPTRCTTCVSGYFVFAEKTTCEAYEAIEHCAEFENRTTCAECEPGFQIEGGNCAEIPSAEHCLKKSNGTCQHCEDAYQLGENDLCVPVPAEIMQHCATPDEDSLGVAYKCVGCEEGYVPVKGLQQGCVASSELKVSAIDNCVRYDNQRDHYCVQCSLDKVLSSDNTACLDACENTQVKMLGRLTNVQAVTFSAFAQCIDNDDNDDIPDGCEVASFNLSGDGRVCLKCKGGFIPIETCQLDTTFFNINDLSSFQEGQAFSVVNCVENSSAIFVPTSSSPDPNCLVYEPADGNKYFCRQCVFGKTGIIHQDDTHYYVDCSDDDMTDCNADVHFGSGFADQKWIGDMYGFNLSYEFSCHSCKDANKIPFIHLDNDSKLMVYREPTGAAPSDPATPTGYATACREPTAEGLKITDATFTGFVEHCALGLIVVEGLTPEVFDKSAVRCLACKNGYLPSFDEKNYHITACQPIENCNATTTDGWFNGCKHCAAGHVKSIDAEGHIDPNNCDEEADAPNCRIYDSETNKCAICERGYSLDADNICIEYDYPFCTSFAMRAALPAQLDADNFNLSYAFYFGATGFDCYECGSSYISVGVDYDNTVCVAHDNIEDQSAEEGSAYPANCKQYFLGSNNSILCQACDAGFVVAADNTECFVNTNLQRCDEASSASACSKCASTSVLSNGACFEKTIENCDNFTVDNGAIKCTHCINNNRLNSGACVAGSVPNCESYDNDGDCEACQDGHVLMMGTCASFAVENCDQGILQTGNEFKCTKCSAGQYLADAPSTYDANFCLQAPVIPGCVTYNDQFVCAVCDSGYYVSNGLCLPRTVVDDNCNEHSQTSDACANCQSGYAVTAGICTKVELLVPFCRYYSDPTTCFNCSRDKFLNANTCNAVANAALISHCKYYSSATACDTCEAGYLLLNNTCVQKLVTGCAAYSGANYCATCLPGLVFKVTTVNGVQNRSCEAPATAIENCIDINSFKKSCQLCNTGFYVNKKSCASVTTTIQNCLYYASANTCSVCQKGYVRSLDQTSCVEDTSISTLDKNCTDLRFESTPVCSVCKPGYYFTLSGCFNCFKNPDPKRWLDFVPPPTGCTSCNPQDVSKCLMCDVGYYMPNSTTCTPYTSGIEAADEFDEDDSSTGLTGAFIAFTVLILSLIR